MSRNNVMLSLSTYWNSHRHDEDGMHMVYEAILLGFDALELGPCIDPALLPGFQKAYTGSKGSAKPFTRFSSVRNFVLAADPEANQASCHFMSSDDSQRQRAIELSQRSIDIAAELGGIPMVLTLGRTSISDHSISLVALLQQGELYSKTYAQQKLALVQAREAIQTSTIGLVKKALDQLIPYAEKMGVRLALESPDCYEYLPNEQEMALLLDEYDSPHLGYWHDFGHIQLKANLGLLDHRQQLEQMLPRLIGCNVHDVEWPAEDHCIPFQGSVDFDQLIPLVPKNIPLVWKINPRRKSDDIKQALVTWKEKYGD
ncbi:MAG: sugar phosphate isomerase/epimerase [Verrucomicrobiales bacterium]|nr:sugar phosphate isomerase/epimerase [Verrucomicrobiales bacterium]